jgi:fibronectin-binding autotransporter adhesin
MIPEPFKRRLAFLMTTAATAALATAAHALPAGGSVAASTNPGTATIGQTSTTLTVNQTADRVIIDWRSFNIASGETVTFNQPGASSIAINRVAASAATTIDGNLNANGGVFLFSPGGLLFGSNARVNVGSLLATTGALSTAQSDNPLTQNYGFAIAPASNTATTSVPPLTIQNGAQINATAGFAAFGGATLKQGGAVTASDSIAYMVADSQILQFAVVPSGLSMTAAKALYFPGKGRVFLDHTGTSRAGANIAVAAPAPALESNFHNVLNISGTLQAGYMSSNANGGVDLNATGAITDGSTVSFDAKGSTITASGALTFNASNLTLGAVQTGSVVGAAHQTLTFDGAVTTTGAMSVTSGTSATTDVPGDILIDADLNIGGPLTFNALGAVTIGPDTLVKSATTIDGTIGGGMSLGSGARLVATGNLNLSAGGAIDASLGTVTTQGRLQVLTDSAKLGQVDAGTLFVETTNAISLNGKLTTTGLATLQSDAGAVSILQDVNVGGKAVFDFVTNMTVASGVSVKAGDRLLVFGPSGSPTANGDLVIGSGAHLVSGQEVQLSTSGGLTLASGATVETLSTAIPNFDGGYPLLQETNSTGGVLLAASRMDLQGQVIARSTIGFGDITLSSVEPIFLGDRVGGPPAGVLNISNAGFQHLQGRMVFVQAGQNVEFGDLQLDSAKLGQLLVGAPGSGLAVTVSGTVTSTGATPINLFIGGEKLIHLPSGDFPVDEVPATITITGALGTAAAPLGQVKLLAVGDILMGTPAYVSAVAADPAFDPDAANALASPAAGHLFVASDSLSVASNARVFQQNAGVGGAHAGLLLLNQGTDPLVVAPDLDALVAAASSTPPDGPVSAFKPTAPTLLSLHGVAYESGLLLDNAHFSRVQTLLGAGVSESPDRQINNCAIGGRSGTGCGDLPTGGAFADGTAGAGVTFDYSPFALTINQTGDRVILDFTGYNIDAGNSVVFNQPSPSSIAISRVSATTPALINGALLGDGGVFLFSPGGLIFGNGAVVNVASFFASSGSLGFGEHEDPLVDDIARGSSPNATATSPAAPITINQGAVINANAGFAAFGGPTITQNGTVIASGSVLYGLSNGSAPAYQVTDEGLTSNFVSVSWNGGEGRLNFNHTGTTIAGQDIVVQTPPSVLEPGYNNVLTISGRMQAGIETGSFAGITFNACCDITPIQGSTISFNAGGGTLFAPGALSISATNARLGNANVGSINATVWRNLGIQGVVSANSTVAVTAGVASEQRGVIAISGILNAGSTLDFSSQGIVQLGQAAQVTAVGSILGNVSGDMTLGAGAHIQAGTGIDLTVGQRLSVAAGAIIDTTSFEAPLFDGGVPVSTSNSNANGGITLDVGDLDLLGQVTSRYGSSPGDISLRIGTWASRAYLGGQDQGDLTNTFNLSNAEFQRLSGRYIAVTSTHTFTDPSESDLTVRDVDLSSSRLKGLYLGVNETDDVHVDGIVTSSGATPVDLTIGWLNADRGASNGDPQFLSFIPDHIYVTGSLGTAAAPLGHVQMLATADIVMGTQGYIDAVIADPIFTLPDKPDASIARPEEGHLFVAADDLSLGANGRIVQQNTASGAGHAGILLTPQTDDPLIVAPDFTKLLISLGFGQEGSGGSTVLPNGPGALFKPQGPELITLHGSATIDGVVYSGPQGARRDGILDPTIPFSQKYLINDCVIGAVTCSSGTPDEATRFDPPLGTTEQSLDQILSLDPLLDSSILSAPASRELIDSFLALPGDDDDDEKDRLGLPVTGTGNGDLWRRDSQGGRP